MFIVVFLNVDEELVRAKMMTSKESKIAAVPKTPCSVFPVQWHGMPLQLY